MEEKLFKFKKLVEELQGYRGRHTELISVYIAAGSNIYAIANQLEYEKSMAENIKSKTTRQNVIAAIEMILRQLKFYKKTPENGLAIFAGNVSREEGKPDLRVWAIEPPFPLSTKLYHCDQNFFLEPLKEMLEQRKERIGLLVIDKKEATLGLLEGKNIKRLLYLSSGIPSKIRAGGQSAARFERLREEATKEFYRRVAEHCKEFFLDKKIKALLIGGPGPTKEEFLKESELITEIREKIIGIRDIGYADEHGLKLLVDESQDLLESLEIMEEKRLLNEFFTALTKELACYGMANVKKALEYGAAAKVIISEDFEGFKESKESMQEIEQLAKSSGAELHFVSSQTQEGLQFKNIAGIGAILRFRLNEFKES
ncbi:MAG: peptide chain release factor aRF-1 [Candidatus Pacearchaeota archaeon]